MDKPSRIFEFKKLICRIFGCSWAVTHQNCYGSDSARYCKRCWRKQELRPIADLWLKYNKGPFAATEKERWMDAKTE